MARFNVRVELHYAQAQHYQTLSAAMSAKGFTGYVTGSDGKKYELPPGEYAFDGSRTAEQIRELATAAASSTGKDSAVRVTEGQSYWRGLKEIVRSQSAYY